MYNDRRLPPLPADIEPIYYETMDKIRGIAARVKEEERSRAAPPSYEAQRLLGLEQASSGKSRITSFTTIPAHRAGLVIGNRGENLKRIERMAQVKLQFDQQWVGPSGEKRMQITGLPEDIEEAIKLIKEKCEEPESRYPTIQLSVPSHRVGLIIGKGGETIRELQERSGAKITIAPDGGQDTVTGERPVNIVGDQESVRRAQDMIHELVTNGTRPSMVASGMAGAMGRNSVTVHIPEAYVGAIIGKKAETIKSFQAASNAKIFVEPTLQPGATKRAVHISGPSPESVAYAQQLVEDKVRQSEAANSMASSGYPSYDAHSSGTIYQAPGEFAAAIDPNAAAAGYDYSQYYQQYYQYYGYAQPGAPTPDMTGGAQQQQPFDYAAYAAQYAQAQQQYQPPQ